MPSILAPIFLFLADNCLVDLPLLGQPPALSHLAEAQLKVWVVADYVR